MAFQIRQRSTLTDKIIHKQILGTRHNATIENGLSSQARITIGASVSDDIDLHQGSVHVQTEPLPQFVRQGLGYRINTSPLEGMHRSKNRSSFRKQGLQHLKGLRDQGISHQRKRGLGIA